MLVLSRKKQEVICIGDDIKIMVTDVRGDRVRLGITAPKDLPIYRKEIYDRIQEETKQTLLKFDINVEWS